MQLRLREAGIPASTRIHDLRHTAATLMLASGNDVATTGKVLGHANPSITATVYAHVLPGAGEQAIGRLGTLLEEAAVG
jgi:integrase